MAKTIAQARSQADPLRNVKPEPPAAPKSYRMQMQGMFGPLRRGEGYYYPIKGWHAGGLDWYYVSYEFTWDNGVYETGSVPWPIHFTPAEDPFVNGESAACAARRYRLRRPATFLPARSVKRYARTSRT